MQEHSLLFSYGTLQDKKVQLANFGRELVGKADALVELKKKMLEITDPDVLVTSGERYHPIVSETGHRNDCVPGTVFSITAAELDEADRYEVSDYERRAVILASGKRAWVYVKTSNSTPTRGADPLLTSMSEFPEIAPSKA